jgi:hypothetical protein
VIPSGADLRVDRVFGQTLAVFLRHFPMFFAVSAAAALPNLLIRKTVLVANSFGAAGTFFDIFVFLVTSTLAEAVVLQAAFEDMRGRQAELLKSFRVARARAWHLIGLAMFMAFGIVVGALFLIVPALFLLAIWYVATPACVVERLSVRKSIDRSMQLTRGHRFKIFAMLAALLVADVGGSFILNGVLRGGNALLSEAGTFTWDAVWGAFYAVFGVVTYRELRVANEGVDVNQIAAVFD